MTPQEDFNNILFKTTWQSPSNIAIVKYWGKKPNQLPMNPSVSMTLNKSVTTTSVEIKNRAIGEPIYTFRFHQQAVATFSPKIDIFFEHLTNRYPILDRYHFNISSQNSFPHSAGIASSASAMSALALACEHFMHFINKNEKPFETVSASEISRLGSGSAVRSLHNGWVLWGKTELLPFSTDEAAVEIKNIHPVFSAFNDTILLIDAAKKSVSSSAGHQLMVNHPYQKGRIDQAHRNIEKTLDALRTGNIALFIDVCEEEALSLHGLMMSSNPGYLLLKPATLLVIDEIRAFREKTGFPVCFTLDAGPNIHLLYPETNNNEIKAWINSTLTKLYTGGATIDDCMGMGPQNLGTTIF